MADLNSLYNALRNADAAGDTEGAKRLAQYIQQMQGAQPPAPETTALGQVKETFKGLVPGAVGLLESAATGASALLPEDMEKSAREKIAAVAGAAKKPFEAAPGYEGSVGRRIGEGLGSMATAPLYLMGLPGVAAGVGIGLASGAGEARTRAEQEGATAEQRGKATAMGTIPGAFDTAVDMALAALPGGLGKSLSVVRRALASAGVEGATEAAQAIAQNAIAKGVYKPDQALLESAGEEGAYGAGVGAIASVLLDMAIPGRTRGAQPTQPPAPAQPPGAPLPPTAPPGTQGTLFSEKEMGPLVAPPAPAAEPISTGKPEGQMDLGLDYQREVAQLYLERERLGKQPQTEEVKARMADLTEQIRSYEEMSIAERRAQAEVEAEQARADRAGQAKFPALATAPELMAQSDEVKARTQGELFPGEDLGVKPAEESTVEPKLRRAAEKGPRQLSLGLRRNPEGQPTTFGQPEPTFTSEDVLLTAIPVRKGMESWIEKNVIGSTRTQLLNLIERQPELVQGNDQRAKLLRALTATEVPAFKESPRAPTRPQKPTAEQRLEPRAGEPSVGVPSEPAAPVVPEPGAGVAGPAGTPQAPVGLGLVPAGQPADAGTQAQGIEPPAVETAAEEAQRRREAEEVAAAMARQQGAAGRGRVAPPRAQVTPTAQQPQPIPEKLYEPTGTSEIGMEEGQKEILRGPQAMLFPMSKREEIAYAERRREEAAPEEAPAPAKDERQAELDFTKEPEPEPAQAAPAPEDTAWAQDYRGPGFNPVYADAEVALYSAINSIGNQIYVGMRKDRKGRYFNRDIESAPDNAFTPEQRERLLDARSKAVFAESKRAAKAPDGPFTGATSNVVKSDSVDQRYADLLQSLMQAMGLGDVRIFLVHPEDMHAPDAVTKYNLYKHFATAQTAGFAANEEGSAQTMGPGKRDYRISFKSGMSESKSIEVITHELGHAIQAIAFNNAPADVQAAIRKEHDAWLQSTKGKTGRELVQMLRNRETAETQMLSVPEGKSAEQMAAYWKSFSEWFADNTSRWASTAEKPVSITEKFFARVAQMLRDLVATVTGRKYPPNKKVAEFLDAMGPGSATLWLTGTDTGPSSTRAEFSVAPSTEALVDSLGPLEPEQKSGLSRLITGFKDQTAEPSYAVKFRTQTADAAATIEHRLREQFDGAVRDKLGKLNPMGLYRQAQDHAKLLLEYFQVGSLVKDKATGLWRVSPTESVRAPAEVYGLIDAWGAKNGYDRERATQITSRILEGVRLDAMRTANRTQGTNFLLHMKDAEIDQLVREYNADPDLQAMSKLMDEARLAMVDNMVAVGRLSKEQGEEWKNVAGYVPFDRIDDFANGFNKIKKISNKGLAQVGKLPELVGSLNRPVGNVFDNYLNTLGWMVGQTMKTDGTVQTLRSLEDIGFAKFLGRSPQGKDNAVGMYVGGEMMYWELPSKYDVLAFKDLNPPKATWLRMLGQFSNVLRTSVTALPPFALKQVTDDVQRAIMTSGVKNPGALLRMSLANFGKLAVAELRGIQHPAVREFGALGLTGEYDFQAGKPATSLLKDLGYKPRGKFETLLHRLEGVTRASDLAVRKAVYDQTLKETNDQLLAQTRAREFINFRRRGASDFVGAMVTTIPFFNAYIQGMDVLYRAASGKDSSSSVGRAQARRMFWSRAATVMMLSSLYALGAGDDEDYQEMDLRTRDSNWILPGGFKLPVPGELGALFKVIPERVVEYMRRQGTPEEQDAWEATRTALAYIFEQYVGRTVPIPQAVKPLLEAFTNHSFFTGRELEGIYQKQQDPSMRRASNTSELAIAIANFSRDVVGVDKISPILVDNALNGYFGSSAGLLVAVTDSLLNPTRVDRPLHKWALLSNYLYDPVGTRRMTEFYEEREKVGRANATLNELLKTDMARAEKYAEAHADELMLEGAINSTLEQLERTRAYRKFLNSVDAAAEMPKEIREAELQEIRKMEVELSSWLREAKAAMR